MGQGVCGHCKGRLNILGIGPGDMSFLNQRAYQAIHECQVIVGYRTYIKLLKNLVAGKEIISSGMTQESRRARQAIKKALDGKNVCLISSGDPGIYGMAGVILELLKKKEEKQIRIEVIPGITAASSCASLLGAPLMNDFAVISLSDLLTSRQLIERRIESACKGDFVIVFYNPKSTKRVKPLERAWQILMRHKSPQTPVGIVRNAQRENEEVTITSLKDMLSVKRIDMGTTIIVGNSKTYVKGKFMITPRGYEFKQRGNR
jgi:precorrin-3B C17-methyltransferase